MRRSAQRLPRPSTALGAVATLVAGALALVGPAVAERSALQTLRTAAARCPDGTGGCGGLAQADVDLGGLRLWHPWREQAGLRLEAEELAITVDADGVAIDARALQLDRANDPAPTRARSTSTPAGEIAPTPPPRRSPLHTHGVPVHVRVHGSTGISRGGVELVLDAPELHLDGHGGATATFTVAAESRGVRVWGTERWTATTVGGDPRRWQAEGPIAIEDGPVAKASMEVSRTELHVELEDAAGGHLAVQAVLPTSGHRPRSLRIHAERFALATLGALGRRTLDAWGLRTTGAHLDAALVLDDLSDGTGTAEVQRLRIDGLVVDHRKLAREPVAFDALELQGQLSWQGAAISGSGWVAHRQARLSLSAQAGPEAFDLRTELYPLPCQAMLDAFPEAMSEMVAGTRLQGELSAHAELHIDRVELARVRAEGAALAAADDPTLGRLELSFPFLERCTVEADDPRLDLAALSGPYHHRFVDDRGHAQRRVMAPGAPGYVSLADVPLLARAFVVMEDRRFWRHDGFDREQIEHALWHNLVKGRVSRGASTISQQAARNLWLGVDRSWGRKLQEALLTARLEASTDKARIMELYLNVIELGSGTHGVDEAALLYFGKPAAELSVLQSIHIAALAPAPARYSERFVDGRVDAEWLDMLHGHVHRMQRAGLISREQMGLALRDELELLDRR